MDGVRAAEGRIRAARADEPAEIRRLLSLGVASITTNVPEIALAIRAESGDAATSDLPLLRREGP